MNVQQAPLRNFVPESSPAPFPPDRSTFPHRAAVIAETAASETEAVDREARISGRAIDAALVVQSKSLFLQLQSHPEHETQSPPDEHRSDIVHFFRGENEVCLTTPRGYFDPERECAPFADRSSISLARTQAGYPSILRATTDDNRSPWRALAYRYRDKTGSD
jgi:hypothetical protein